jgi:N-acetylneuraminate synthase
LLSPVDLLAQLRDSNLPPLVVAELSGNHGGDLDKAIELIDQAAESGADAIKLQTYKPETITVEGRDDRFLLKEGLWAVKYLSELYAEAMTPWEWHAPLAERSARHGLPLFSSPFDESAVDFLEESISPPLYKVASFELNHFPMLRKIARTGKPVLASVGVSTNEEIEHALRELRENGCPEIILLHCVSEYPAKPEDFHLHDMPRFGERHGTLYGLSDHSLGHAVAIAATVLGARVIEKHFALDREEDSIDGAFSMLPLEFMEMVEAVRVAHASVEPSPAPAEDTNPSPKGSFFKRSILVSAPVAKGETLTEMNLRVARPGDGMCPSQWELVLGQTANCDLPVGHPLCEEDLAG